MLNIKQNRNLYIPQKPSSLYNNINSLSNTNLNRSKSNTYSKNDDQFKDSLEGSISINHSKENALIPDSLNNTRLISKNNSKEIKPGLKRPLINMKVKLNKSKDSSTIYNDDGTSELNEEDEEETKKITYKYISNYPFINEIQKLSNSKTSRNRSKEVHMINENINKFDYPDNEGKNNINNFNNINIIDDTEPDSFYWFAAYGKLINSKNLYKILNFYEKNVILNIKEKPLIIKNFEISFDNNSKPYIHYCKNGYIFTKLYFLSLKQLNCIFNYINKIDVTISKDKLSFNNNVGNFVKIEHKNINFNYNNILCLGYYLNYNIFTFTNLSYDLWKSVNLSKKFPRTYKIQKLVKNLITIFPNYSIDFFICYFLSDIHNNINNSLFDQKVAKIKGFLTKNFRSSSMNNNLNMDNNLIDLSKDSINQYLNNKNYNSNITNNNNESSTQSININNINLNLKMNNNNNNNYNSNSNTNYNTNYNTNTNYNSNNLNCKKTKNKNCNMVKLNSNTNFSSGNNSNRIDFTNVSINNYINKSNNYINNKLKHLKGSGVKTFNCCSNQSSLKKNGNHFNKNVARTGNNSTAKGNNTTIDNRKNNSTFGGADNNHFKHNNTNNNIYIVNRKLKTELDLEYEDDSSVNGKANNNTQLEKKIFVTPKKKKMHKYYS